MTDNSVQSVDVYIVSATLPKFDSFEGWTCSDVFNRGTRVGPEGKISCHMTDVFQCRFKPAKKEVTTKEALELLHLLQEKKITWCQVNLIWS